MKNKTKKNDELFDTCVYLTSNTDRRMQWICMTIV